MSLTEIAGAIRDRSVRGSRPVAARKLAFATLETLVAVAVATGAVAALQSTTHPAGLGAIYLLAVLEVAIRRGEGPALAAALLSFLTLNFFFVTPRYRLAIAHSQDVVELVVFLIVAVVVGRLAVTSRLRAAQAESRARLASAREREATLLAEVASAILAGDHLSAQLSSIGERVANATGATGAEVAFGPEPGEAANRVAVPLRTRERPTWLLIDRDLTWHPEDVQRLSEPLAGLISLALERERLTEQAAETEAARRAERARTAILHAISHDLRSPLTAITTASSGLRSPGLTASERSELRDVIDAEARRLARMVDDLLDLSKIEAGALTPQEDWCDLHDVLASAAAHLRSDRPIEFALPGALPLIRADPAQLERVFWNLIENAVKFSPPGSPVRLDAVTAGDSVTVRVTDAGRGIADRDRARVFEPFFRGRGATGSGSGLGLAICRGFVEANGGSISVQSTPGPGTTFAVSLPVVPQPVTVT
jgi:two-component system, OmpR family, sensor histidine kinase KdpD